jgi:hypothetical protein
MDLQYSIKFSRSQLFLPLDFLSFPLQQPYCRVENIVQEQISGSWPTIEYPTLVNKNEKGSGTDGCLRPQFRGLAYQDGFSHTDRAPCTNS